MRVCLVMYLVLVGYIIPVQSNVDKCPNRLRRQAGGGAWLNCPVSLPQRSSGYCNILRQQNLDSQKSIYQLALRPPLPMPLINMTFNQTIAHHLQDPFACNHFKGYVSMLKKNKAFSADWKKSHPKEINAFQEYQDMFQQFRHNLGSNGSTGYYRFVSNVEPFQDILGNWASDAIFAEQRLSGCNPMVLRRVTDDSSDVGLSLSELRKTLNRDFDWEAAIQRASGSSESIDKAIEKGKLYALRYEVFDDMVSFKDTVDHDPRRTLWPSKSPVALFVQKSANNDKRLVPVAIQIDYKPDSPVFSPDDGGEWMLAKWVVQATDYVHSQMIEHLVKVHLFAEPFCVVLNRQLSSKHPLHQLLKYHCRGVFATNTIGSPSLITADGYMDQLTAMGFKGTLLLVGRGYKTLSWKDADFDDDIKKRGLDDEKMLPYFPYRDDCKLFLMAIKRMVEDYVSSYYTRRADVMEDKELQAFVNELSVEGTGPDGGRGQVKDFPAALKERDEVVDIVTKLIWILSVKHAVVNYPVSDYGAFTPLLPTKIFNDTRVPPGEFSVFNLPNGDITAAQIEVAMNVGIYHYDTLFDYFKELSDPVASRVVEFYFHFFKYAVSPRLKYRNHKRYRDGHLTYPYLQYSWVPNGIQT